MPGIYQICKFRLDFIEFSSKNLPESENEIDYNNLSSDTATGNGAKRTGCTDSEDQLILRGMHLREHVEQDVLAPICLTGNGHSQGKLLTRPFSNDFSRSSNHPKKNSCFLSFLLYMIISF